MFCPACGRENGAFSTRCRNCGRVLGRPDRRVTSGRRRLSLVAVVGSILGGASALALLALVFLISRQDLWSALLAPEPAESTPVVARAPSEVTLAPLSARPVPTATSAIPSTLGAVIPSGDWRVVVDGFQVLPDDTVNGWSQVVITCTVKNLGMVAANLEIPATTAAAPDSSATPGQSPNFQPMNAVAENAPSVVNGLRLYLLDSGRRPFGGGFGSTNGGYRLMAAPGDMVRLAYHFRFPTNVGAPAVLRMVFPASGGGQTYEVHLDRRSDSPTALDQSDDTRAEVGEPIVVGDGWRVTLEGVAFGADPGQGERPVSVSLDVENLTDTDQPALTDPSDQRGVLRDFYLTDGAGHLAYSHMDDLPGVIVPAHATRPVTVMLYTTDLSSSTRPLYFTAVVDWRTNQYARFLIH